MTKVFPRRRLAAALALAAGLGLAGEATAQQVYNRGPYGWHDMMWGRGFFGGPFMIIFWILLIVVIVLVVRWAVRSGSRPPWEAGRDRGKDALDILKERYARGEITREEFQKMKQDLTG